MTFTIEDKLIDIIEDKLINIIKKLLTSFPVLRDDYIKTYKVASVLIYDEINLRRLNFESVRRVWQKLQEEHEELRGKNRQAREVKGEEVRKAITSLRV